MEAKRKPGRPPGSLNKATIAKRAEVEVALAVADAVESESSVSDAPCEPTVQSKSSPPTPELSVPEVAPVQRKVLGRRAQKTVQHIPDHNVPVHEVPVREPVLGRRAADLPPKPRKRARVVVLDESSSSDEFTVVRRRKPRRVAPQEPEPICVLGDALTNHRQRMDSLKITYDGFYKHLK